MSRGMMSAFLMTGLALTMGCGQNATTTSTASGEDSRYVLSSEPAGAESVMAARENVQDGEPVAVLGRIGGEANPWVDGLAAFTIVDPSLQPCTDGCETPWDYCCDTDALPKATATVKLVDATGQVLGKDARELLKVKELTTVVVKGRAKRDSAGNLTVLADGVYVKQ